MKKIISVLLAAAFIMPLAACGSDGSQGDGSGQMYNASLPGNPESLDPQFADDAASNTVISNLYSGLMSLDGSGNPVCRNAASYEVSEDQLVYTFHLREDNYWFYDFSDDDIIDDGEYFPVTAKDYIFAFQRLLDPEMHSPYAEMFSCIDGGEESLSGRASAQDIAVTSTDDFTLIIRLAYPCADFINRLATNAAVPCNEEFFLSTKGRYGLDDDSVMSNGAFFVRQWFYDPYGKNNILYMRQNKVNSNDEHRVYPSYLSFTIEKNDEDIAKLFKDGDIDCMTVTDSSAYSSKKYKKNAVRSTTLGFIFNIGNKTCADLNFRKALALSIDRKALDSKINSDVTAAGGIIPPAVKLLGRSYRELSDDSPMSVTDKEQAAELIESAKRSIGAETFEQLKILMISGTADSAYVHYVTQSWKESLGIYIGIEEVSAEEFEKRLEDGEYQIALYPLKGCYNSGISALESAVDCEYIRASGEAKAAVAELWRCGNASELVEKYASCEKQILGEYGFIPLFYKNEYLITKKECADIIFDPFSYSVCFREAKYFDD
ncbi:MAG: peptide ABC transporter substrate-binding protein [Ruminococcus sp.]